MKTWLSRNITLVSLLLAFLLYWFFGDLIVFLTIIAVIGFFLGLKGIYKITFLYFEVILFAIYLLFAFLGLLFFSFESVQVLIIILGLWLIVAFFRNKR